MHLYLVRHGQSEANLAGIMQGAKIDRTLTALGRRQAQSAAEKLEKVHFNHIYASPLMRASQTAEIITGPQATVTFDPRVMEFDYGDWDGQPISRLIDNYPNFFHDGDSFADHWQVSHGETYGHACQRLQSFMNDLTVDSDENVLVVAHGMLIRLWTCWLLNMNGIKTVDEPLNAGITRFDFNHRIPVLRYYSR